MTGGSAPDSLFSRLLGTRASRTSKDGVKGHEEYLTQIMAFLLQQDAGLTARWVKAWFGLTPAGPVDVVPEDTLDSSNHSCLPDSSIDVRVSFVDEQGQAHRIYVENKVEAKLNQYAYPDGKTEDQVRKYGTLLSAVCRASTEPRGLTGHIVVCGLRPQDERTEVLPEGVEWHPPRYWWDFYEVVRVHLEDGESASEPARWMQAQFVQFCQEKRLLPPRALRPADADAEAAARLLGLAAERCASAGKVVVTTKAAADNAGTWRATVYWTAATPSEPTRKRYWLELAGNSDGITTRAYWERVGELPAPELPEGLWVEAPLEQQIECFCNTIDALPRCRAQFAPVLARMGEHRDAATEIVDALWRLDGVFVRVNPSQTEIRARSDAFPKSVEVVLRVAAAGPELMVYLGTTQAQERCDPVIAEVLGEPRDRTATYRCFPVPPCPERATQLASALMAVGRQHLGAGSGNKMPPRGEASP